MSSVRVARSFASQAELAMQNRTSHKSSQTFDTIYFVYLKKAVESEIKSQRESSTQRSDSVRHRMVIASLIGVDSTLGAILPQLNDTAYLGSALRYISLVSRELHALDTAQRE
jgi:hypothetical protein